MLSPGRSTAVRLFAGIIFVAWPVGFLIYTTNFLRIKVRHQHRADLIKDKDRTGNYWRWVDMPPPVGAELQARRDKLRHHFHSGFVSQHGALFEDFKRQGSALYAIPVLLLSRLCVGVLTGVAKMPDSDTKTKQSVCLVSIFLLLLGYMAWVRPFLVPIANACECVVVLGQLITVFLGFWLLAEPAGEACEALDAANAAKCQGVEDQFELFGVNENSLACNNRFPDTCAYRPPTSAFLGVAMSHTTVLNTQNSLIMLTTVFMCLRFVGVMLPGPSRFCRALSPQIRSQRLCI